MPTNDLTLLWRLSPDEETVVKMIRGLRDNPDTRNEIMYDVLHKAADRAAESED